LVKVRPLLDEIGDWQEYLTQSEEEAELSAIRRHERTGRPLGSDTFIDNLEKLTGRFLRRKKRGPKGASKK